MGEARLDLGDHAKALDINDDGVRLNVDSYTTGVSVRAV